MAEENPDQKALLRFLKQGVGIFSPRLKELWDLYDNIRTWKDEKEKARVKKFLEAYDDLLQFLEKSLSVVMVVSTDSGHLATFSEGDLFSAKVTAVVEAAAEIDWDKEPLEKEEVRRLYSEIKKTFAELSSQIQAIGQAKIQ